MKAAVYFKAGGMPRSERGSFTIELSIFVTLIMMIIITLLYMALLFYQETRLQAIANETAHRGAMTYQINSRDLYTARIDEAIFSNKNPYRRFSTPGYAQKKTENYLSVQNTRHSLLENTGAAAQSADIRGNMLHRVVEVNVAQSYTVPLEYILKLFGVPVPYPVTARAESVVLDPPEFIRNIDFAGDMVETVDQGLMGGTLGNAMFKLKGAVDWGMGKMKAIFS